tara:strand:+ start:1234 stop:1815 length:582 start_codon:yes stop_codon:yes gene_type:complete
MKTLTFAKKFINLKYEIAQAFEVISDGKCGCLSKGCFNIGKHQLEINDKDFGTTDKKIVDRMWSLRPTANLLIHTGTRNSLLVIDVDKRNDGLSNLIKLRKEFPEMDDTFIVETGSGGFHYYFKCNDFIESSTNIPYGGIDLRGENGYVIGPGSSHKSGHSYKVVNDVRVNKISNKLIEFLKSCYRQLKEKPS